MGENEINRNERNIKDSSSALKQILHLPKSATNVGILFETGIWPIKERIEYSTTMLFHSVISDDERIAKEIVAQNSNRRRS